MEVTAEDLASDLPFQSRVEPRGFEPLTSAVQSQIHDVAVVRRCSKIPANKHILSSRLSCVFVIIRMGWCTTGVNEPREAYSVLQQH